MEKFTKDSLSQNKSIPAALPAQHILDMGQVLAFGEKKYGRWNWAKCPPDQVYLYEDALLRHIFSYVGGEKNDPETGLSHLAHAGCNIAFLSHFEGIRTDEQKQPDTERRNIKEATLKVEDTELSYGERSRNSRST